MSKFVYIVLLLIGTGYLEADQKRRLVWPSAPDEPRIEHIASVKTSYDLGIEKGFLSKIYDFVFGEEDPVLSSPFGIHADKQRVYVTDISSKSLHIFDKSNDKVITVIGSDDEKFLYPIDVVANSKGNIYVSDSIRAKVYVFDNGGDFIYEIKLKVFQRPVGIALSIDEKRLYIVDALAGKIHVSTVEGKYIDSIGKIGSGAGEFNRPTFIDVANDGKIYVTDSMNHRVQILNSNGSYIHSFGKLGQNIGDFGSPRGISIDSEENIFVSDTMFNTIQIFNKKGELLMVFGSYGLKNGEFSLAEDISIVADGTIYIADTNNKRIQVFRLLEQTQDRSTK